MRMVCLRCQLHDKLRSPATTLFCHTLTSRKERHIFYNFIIVCFLHFQQFAVATCLFEEFLATNINEQFCKKRQLNNRERKRAKKNLWKFIQKISQNPIEGTSINAIRFDNVNSIIKLSVGRQFHNVFIQFNVTTLDSDNTRCPWQLFGHQIAGNFSVAR